MTDKPMRVLHVLGELRPSGAERMLCVAAPFFTERGVTADILSTGAVCGAFAGNLRAAGFGIHHIPFAKSPRFFVGVFRLMRGRYDVIHLHTERANFWLGLTALLARPAAVLRTIHNSFAFGGALRLRRKLQRRLLDALGVRHVAVGKSVQDTETRCFGTRTDIVHNWYDTERFTPPQEVDRKRARAALTVGEEENVIVSVGNCGSAKNHDRLIEAIALLSPADRPLYLHVGTEQPDGRERSLTQRVGLQDRIRFLGPMDDVRIALYAADAFVMPSLYEGFSVAAIEGLAVGLPTVLTDVEGLRDLRQEFPRAIYATPQAESLASALRSVLSLGSDDRRHLSKAFTHVAQVTYGVERGVSRYVDLYRGAAAQ
jgi:glycosyltransferase involved in cell wall biosynthesis